VDRFAFGLMIYDCCLPASGGARGDQGLMIEGVASPSPSCKLYEPEAGNFYY
jgi:hypothetical protein